ncbi:MAG TPA: DUF1275 family protein [Friedmanniella sp.]
MPERPSLLRDPAHGPLPALLLGLTVLTGVVDAVSILGLDRVFVANMTGNVVFLAFAAVGAPGFSLVGSLAALAGFLVGAGGGGLVLRSQRPDRAALLAGACCVELVLVAASLELAAAAGHLEAVRWVMTFLLAVALGAQNAAARRLAVPDLTTTVLTMTLTGIAADAKAGRTLTRRLLAVAAMAAGALIGALLVLHVSLVAGMAAAVVVLAAVTAGALAALRRPAAWRA